VVFYALWDLVVAEDFEEAIPNESAGIVLDSTIAKYRIAAQNNTWESTTNSSHKK
jgi:hypothetical protein